MGYKVMRLIDADRALEKIRVLEKEPDYQHEGEEWRSGLYLAETVLDEVPTATGYCNVEELYKELDAYSYPSPCGWAIGMDSVKHALRKYLKED